MARRNRRSSPEQVTNSDQPIIARVMIRVSDVRGRDQQSHQGREFLSPEMQLNAARAICQVHGWTFDEETSWRLRDLDQSASRKSWEKRPGMAQHVKDAKAGAYHVLIFYTLSRMARNAAEGLDLWEIFDEAGVRLYFVKESIDTSTATGRMVRTILLAVAEMQADQIAEYAEDAHALRAEKGMRPPRLPHWLKKDGSGVVIVEEKAQVMRRMLSLRLESQGYRTIARNLNAEGLTMPDGGEWNEDAILGYLSGDNLDRFCGTAVYRLARGDKRIADAYPAIVDTETVARVHGVNASVRSDFPFVHDAEGWDGFRGVEKIRGRSLETKYLLSSLLRCAICGGPMRSGGSDAKGRHYFCTRARTNAAAHESGRGTSLSAEGVEDAVARVLRLVMTQPPQAVSPAKKTARAPKPKPLTKMEDADIIYERMNRLVNMLWDGKVEQAVYDRQLAEMQAKLKAIQEGNTRTAEIDSQTVLEDVRTAANANDWRAAFLHLVEQVEAPVEVPGLEYFYTKSRGQHYGSGTARRVCRVSLRFPVVMEGQMRQVFLSPLYRESFTGQRVVLGADGEALNIDGLKPDKAV